MLPRAWFQIHGKHLWVNTRGEVYLGEEIEPIIKDKITEERKMSLGQKDQFDMLKNLSLGQK